MVKIDNGRNVCFMDIFYMLVTIPQINTCKKYNMPLEVWTMDSESKIANINPYISGITSNYIDAEKLFATL